MFFGAVCVLWRGMILEFLQCLHSARYSIYPFRMFFTWLFFLEKTLKLAHFVLNFDIM